MGVAVFAPPRCADFSAPNAGIEIGPSSVTTASIMAIAFRGASDFSKSTIGPPSLISCRCLGKRWQGDRRAPATIGVSTAYPRKVAVWLLPNECHVKKDSQPRFV